MTMDHVEAVLFTHSLASMVQFFVSSKLLQGPICFIRSWVYSSVLFSLLSQQFLGAYTCFTALARVALHWARSQELRC